jgi:putative flippase GtrA
MVIMEKTKKQNILSNFLQSLFSGQSKNGFVELFRYTLVGGLAFCADMSVLFTFTHFLKVHYLISAALAFLVGLAVCYILNVKWVFVKRNVKNKLTEIIYFTIIGIVGLALNHFFIWFFTESFLFHYLVSKLIATFLVYLWNFSARKFLLFR